jgi:hypothetical protein
MYNISELERKWVRYRQKRYLKYGFYGAAVLILLFGPMLFVSFRKAPSPIAGGEKKLSSGSATTVAQAKSVPAKTIPASTTGEQSPAEETLAPGVPSLEEKKLKESAGKAKPKMLITVTDKNAQAGESGTERKAIKMEMVDTKNRTVAKEIEQRFPLTKDYDDAMYLAKYYYGKRKYKKAEYWAMQANSIDSTQEESWIIFGKAIAKRGHRADALRVLQAFYDRSGSIRVKELIDKIRKGKKY